MKSQKRIFARRRSRIMWRVLAVTLAVTTTMAACAPRTDYWSPAQSPKKNKVDWVSYSHEIRPSTMTDGLSGPERERLDQFAADVSLGYGDQVVIRTPKRYRATMATALVRYFRARRLEPSVQVIDTAVPVGDRAMTVVVGRFVVTPPKCPDWTKPAGPDPSNRIGSNFGCANTSNLGLMVADPGDLVRGRPKGPGDGHAASRLVRKYRDGKVTNPANVSSGGGQ